MPTRDNVTPGERWAFDSEVTDAFDDMLSRSIPQYDVMRDLVTSLAARFVVDDSMILDLGCSRGEALARVRQHALNRGCRFVGVEVSLPMYEAARERFLCDEDVEILPLDLRSAFPEGEASVVLSVLTIQFIPIEYRQAIVARVFRALRPGGAFLLVEKVLGSSDAMNQLLVDEHHALKRRNGYSDDDIERKKHSLEGVLVPVTAAWNEDILRSAGFGVERVWQWCNFTAWVAVKQPRPQAPD